MWDVFGGESGFSFEPRSVDGEFNIDDMQCEKSGAITILKGKMAEDAYQMLIRFHAVLDSLVKNCILNNSIFTAMSLYNFSNNNVIDSN